MNFSSVVPTFATQWYQGTVHSLGSRFTEIYLAVLQSSFILWYGDVHMSIF